ncbi:hypothetical protein MNBD_GAMMA23-309 [hydrothermal vent metagenome]|uniref:Sigma factor RpoE regulatory protein RseC n=1 Tax=hydrothermal vent metagenome TaxID=652676 RepID=A0A3B1ABP7_9ZZZZ
MIEQAAKVLRSENDKIFVEVNSQSSCGSCSAKAGCGKSLLDNVFKTKPLNISVDNTLGAKVNDDVIVGLNESALLQVSFYLYLLPLLSMLFASIMAVYLMPAPYSEISSIAAAVIGLFAGSRYSRGVLNKKEISQQQKFQPVLLKVMPNILST